MRVNSLTIFILVSLMIFILFFQQVIRGIKTGDADTEANQELVSSDVSGATPAKPESSSSYTPKQSEVKGHDLFKIPLISALTKFLEEWAGKHFSGGYLSCDDVKPLAISKILILGWPFKFMGFKTACDFAILGITYVLFLVYWICMISLTSFFGYFRGSVDEKQFHSYSP